jgi:hypothetical protein
MKKPIKFSKAVILALLVFSGHFMLNSLQAQSIPKAKYDQNAKVLSMDESAVFGYLFQLDIASMGFANKEKADFFFSNLTTELVSFQVNFEKHTADVLLSTRMKPDWRAKDWNAYLAQLPKP